jgi:cobalamin synthase
MQPVLNTARRHTSRLRHSCGQGTVEYVGIVLAVGALLLAFTSALPRQAATSVAKKVEAAVVKAIDNTVGGGTGDGSGGTSD